MDHQNILVRVSNEADVCYASIIISAMERSAIERGTGIAKREIRFIEEKLKTGEAIIAITSQNIWVGFCYFQLWENDLVISNSGMIVDSQFRNTGVARLMKACLLNLCTEKFPKAKIVSITTSSAVMKLNNEHGFKAVSFEEITSDVKFWEGCKACANYFILEEKKFKNCICTGMQLQKK